jgi:hypothetical protein
MSPLGATGPPAAGAAIAAAGLLAVLAVRAGTLRHLQAAVDTLGR